MRYVVFSLLLIPVAWASRSALILSPQASIAPKSQTWAIQNIETYFFGPERFDRISEYFTGQENIGPYLYVRSDPDSRPGYYFKLSLNRRCMDLPAGTQCTVEYISIGDIQTREHTFVIPKSDRRYQTSLYLGFSGKDSPSAQAIAWCVTLRIPNQAPIVFKSPLWEMP